MGDIISDLHSEGHVTPRQFRAWVVFLADLQAAHGRSAGLVGATAEKVQTGVREPLWPPGGPRGIVELDHRLNLLRPHERRLMAAMVKCRESSRGSLSDLGRQMSGYKTAKTTRAVMVGRIGALSDRLAEIYLGPEGA